MTILNKTIIATTVSFIALGGAAFADGHELNIGLAMSDMTLDTDNSGDVSVDEIIDGNEAFFDTDGNGTIDANERGEAELLISRGNTAQMPTATDGMGAEQAELNVGVARLDMSLDTDGDGDVDNDEIIDGNMAVFDADGNGTIDAQERGIAEERLESGANVISLDTNVDAGMTAMGGIEDFNVALARTDMMLDADNSGDVDTDEIIDGNMALFDTDGNGTLDAAERGEAEQFIEAR